MKKKQLLSRILLAVVIVGIIVAIIIFRESFFQGAADALNNLK